MKNLLIINGPNLNLLGEREPGTYGSDTYESICAEIKAKAAELGFDDCECFQSNHEGEIIDKLHAATGQVRRNPQRWGVYPLQLCCQGRYCGDKNSCYRGAYLQHCGA